MSHKKQRPRAVAFLYENSMFLIAGAIAALIWANVDKNSYDHFVHLDLTGGDSHHAATAHDETGHDEPGHGDVAHGESHETPAGNADASDEASKDDSHGKTASTDEIGHDAPTAEQHGVTLHFLINDILMAIFFAIAGKEVWEAMLPGGALSDPKKAATPLLATV